MRLLLSCLLVVMTISVAFAAQNFPVLDSNRQATVIYPAELTKVDEASAELVSYLKKATGEEFHAVSEAEFRPATGAYPIYVGACQLTQDLFEDELAEMDQDAFLVVVEPRRVFLVGPTSHATYWAVCDFLERYAGVRWLIPGPLGEDVPHRDRITVPPIRRIETPKVLSRWWSGAQHGGNWSKRMRMRYRHRFHHNLGNVFDPDKYFDEHPEYFAEYGGNRSNNRPCLTEPATIEVAARTAREAWAADPSLESFSFGPMDGQNFCDCPTCHPLKRTIKFYGWPYNNNSYLFFGWLNKVALELAKTDPDKLVGTLAYFSYVVPPPEMRFERNILPYMCVTIGNSAIPRCRRANYDLYRRWGDKVNQIGIYDYGYGMGYSIPRIYTHVFQDTIQYAVKHNLKGFYAEAYANWGLDGPRLYMMTHILWDPEVNVDKLVNEWNERMFREAAEPMKKYFARCEQAWNEQPDPGGSDLRIWRLLGNPEQFRMFTPQIMTECTGYLDEAAAMATTDIVRQRIQFFRKTWEITRLLGGEWWQGERVRMLMEQNAPLDEVAAAFRAVSDRPSYEEFAKQVREMVGGDNIAFYPWTRKNWLTVPKEFKSDLRYWTATKLVDNTIRDVQRRKFATDRWIHWVVERRITDAFEPPGPEAYNAVVKDISTMVQKIAIAAPVPLPLTLDGDLSDEAWESAEPISNFTVVPDNPAEYPTTIKMVHDDCNLYVAIECMQDTSKLSGIRVHRDGPVEADDSITLFLRPASEDKPYLQVAISAAGGLLDAMFLPTGRQFGEPLEYKYDFVWATNVQEDRWTAELSVPLKQIGWYPVHAPTLRCNAVRRVVSCGDEISTWFPKFGEEGPEHIRRQGWLVLTPG